MYGSAGHMLRGATASNRPLQHSSAEDPPVPSAAEPDQNNS